MSLDVAPMSARNGEYGWIAGTLFVAVAMFLCGTALAKDEKAIDFYKGSSFSSIAIPLKRVKYGYAKTMSLDDEVRVLEPGLDKLNVLPTEEHYCLLINHILDDDGQQQSEKSYYALKLVFIDKYTPGAKDVAKVARNSGSWRIRRSNARPLNGQATQTIPLSSFVATHDQKRLDLVDQQLGYQWHGAPLGSRHNSWDRRSFWKSSFGDESYSPEAFYERIKIKVNPFGFLLPRNKAATSYLNALLISYSPAPSTSIPATVISSGQAVTHCFPRLQSIAAYLQLFTPIGGVQKDYLLVFDSQSRLLDLQQ